MIAYNRGSMNKYVRRITSARVIDKKRQKKKRQEHRPIRHIQLIGSIEDYQPDRDDSPQYAYDLGYNGEPNPGYRKPELIVAYTDGYRFFDESQCWFDDYDWIRKSEAEEFENYSACEEDYLTEENYTHKQDYAGSIWERMGNTYDYYNNP